MRDAAGNVVRLPASFEPGQTATQPWCACGGST
jgi:hypothetical protein